jgi:hypothetical protein
MAIDLPLAIPFARAKAGSEPLAAQYGTWKGQKHE